MQNTCDSEKTQFEFTNNEVIQNKIDISVIVINLSYPLLGAFNDVALLIAVA